MTKINPGTLAVLLVLVSSGCARTGPEGSAANREPLNIKVEQMDAVASGGNRQAVLSLHKKFSLADGCKFGLTLTNNLPYEISNIAFRFAAHTKGDVPSQEILRNFFEIDPAKSQYREVTFSGLTCDEIADVEVTDPGRCALGKLNRLSSQPGDCIRLVHIAETPYVKLIHN